MNIQEQKRGLQVWRAESWSTQGFADIQNTFPKLPIVNACYPMWQQCELSGSGAPPYADENPKSEWHEAHGPAYTSWLQCACASNKIDPSVHHPELALWKSYPPKRPWVLGIKSHSKLQRTPKEGVWRFRESSSKATPKSVLCGTSHRKPTFGATF